MSPDYATPAAQAEQTGRPRIWPLRETLNAIFYMVRGSCAWRSMPHDLPPWQTAYGYYRQWRDDGIWEQINTALMRAVCVREGREPQPSAAIIDVQSVKTAKGGDERGVDVHKRVSGRKRHIVVDALGLLVLVHNAGIPDSNGGRLNLQQSFERMKHSVGSQGYRPKLIWADGGYEDIVNWVERHLNWLLEIVRHLKDAKGFVVLPRHWVVERTFGWLGRYRRPGKHCGHQPRSSEAMVYAASIHHMLRLLAAPAPT